MIAEHPERQEGRPRGVSASTPDFPPRGDARKLPRLPDLGAIGKTIVLQKKNLEG
jgi:hypothetical protein